MKFVEKIIQVFKVRDLRVSIFFVLAMIAISRLAAHIPLPGVNIENLQQFFRSNQILGLLNIFSGGGMENFSIVAMGVAPYITASIIFQLLVMIVPKLEELSKEPGGYQRINRWTRLLTVPLAFIQAYGLVSLLKSQSSYQIITNTDAFTFFTMLLAMTTGTLFLMWIGELISERHIGNGISILIFAGIVSNLPGVVGQSLLAFDKTQALNFVIFAVIALITTVTVVIINEGKRQIPVQYARHVRGNKQFGGVTTYLPLRVNVAGVIPIIFAISLILFPPMMANFFVYAQSAFLVSAAKAIIAFFNNTLYYGIMYFVLVFIFTYFYTAVIFHPQQIAENLQRQGGFIPGIRPGKNTAEYVSAVTNRILLAGAFFLAMIAILPLIVKPITGLTSMAIGGTSLLIVVSVVIDMLKQIESGLSMRDYEGM